MGIIAIVGSIAYSTYQSQALSSRRADAKIKLTTIAQRLESCRARTFQYQGCETFPQNSDQGFYQVTATVLNATAFLLQATPVITEAQVHDVKCTAFSLDQRGLREATGLQANECW